MKPRLTVVLLLAAAVLFASCASTKTETKVWKSGDSIICPHCGREFPVPEKLGR